MSGQAPNQKDLASPNRVADHDDLLEGIHDSFGSDIAAEAKIVLSESGNEKLPLLTLIAMAEERHFQRQVGGLTALSQQRTDSQFQVVEEDDEEDEDGLPEGSA